MVEELEDVIGIGVAAMVICQAGDHIFFLAFRGC